MRSVVLAIALAGVASAFSPGTDIARREVSTGRGVLDTGLNIAAQVSPLNDWSLGKRQSVCENPSYVVCANDNTLCAPAGRVCCLETKTSCPANTFCMHNGTATGCCDNGNDKCFLGDGKPIGLGGAVSKNIDINYDVNLYADWYTAVWNCDGSVRTLFTNTTATAEVLFDNTVAGFVIFSGAEQGAEYKLNITNQIDRVVFQTDTIGCSPNYKFTYNTKGFNWLTITWLIPANEYATIERNPILQVGRITIYSNAADIAKVQLGDPNASTSATFSVQSATGVAAGASSTDGPAGNPGVGGPSGAGAGGSGTGGPTGVVGIPSAKPSAAHAQVTSHNAAVVCAVILAGLWLAA
ncbi:hypothetical protein Q8F55_008192 [Vanrija albida]|uniref:Uncharacterized protein n=1 Tax=Vanrija albida TaxID=181172 RepID=A0ABR3PWK4_9TREE